ncbi:hypothetical protein F4859DRAFT_458915 [Xylaria cf. heliscus]|nr:hypothetical protein F4859DRAFT_458915 [Xylaria cf. heliscus]
MQIPRVAPPEESLSEQSTRHNTVLAGDGIILLTYISSSGLCITGLGKRRRWVEKYIQVLAYPKKRRYGHDAALLSPCHLAPLLIPRHVSDRGSNMYPCSPFLVYLLVYLSIYLLTHILTI